MTEPSPKYLALSRELEGRIRGGLGPTGRMPSVRDLAEEHGVSVVTASRALQVLRDKGLINTVHRSGCYLARNGGGKDAAPTGEHFALCLRITPGLFQRAADTVTRSGFEAAARRLGLKMDDSPFDLATTRSAGTAPAARDLARQARRAADAGLQGLFLMPARVSEEEMRLDERLLSVCRAAGLPVVLIERNLRGRHRPLAHDLVGLDDVGGAAALTRVLLDHGCRRPALVVASPISTHEDRTAGYLAELHAAGPAKYAPLVLRERTDLPRKATFARLAGEFLAAKADGAVCYNDYTAIGLVLELLARGVRVPRDVAVAGFDDLPIGNQFAVGITTYTLPAEEVARHAVR
ncbi:MAG TPA: GntR family transcriptional regulator, partial [Gemmataceae bacterium]